MKVLMVAVFNERSTNNSQADGFQKCGAEVLLYNYREMARRLGSGARDTDLIERVEEERPDIVFFSKCNGVDIRVIKACNELSKTVLWYMDPMSNFDKELALKMEHCSHTFIGLWDPYEVAKKNFDNVHFLHEGYDHTCNYPAAIPGDIEPVDVSFIGDLRGTRQFYWDNIQEFSPRQFTNAYGWDHSEAVGDSKINLNFTDGGTSDRTYKVLASKGFLLTQDWPHREDDFVDGVDLVVFKNLKDLKQKIKYYLDNSEERKAIAASGHKTVQKFSRINFASKILKTVYPQGVENECTT
jgi:hypothetical protein